MTRAPMSASCRVQKGAAMACSSDTTVMPCRGRVMLVSLSVLSWSERARQAQHMLGDVAQDQVGGNRRHLVQACLAELAFHVVFVGKAETAMELDAGIGRLPAGLGGQV